MRLAVQAITAAALISAVLAVTPSYAVDARFIASLKKLDPDTRLEQVCDLEAMNRIGREDRAFHPDRAKSDAVTSPRHVKDTLVGTGGAFRSNGQWYSFSFNCKGSPDHLTVQSFSYQVGKEIPKDKWNTYGLWD